MAHVQTSAKVYNNLDYDSIEEGEKKRKWSFNANPIKKVPSKDLPHQVK